MEKYNQEGIAILHHMPDLVSLSIPEINQFRKSGCQIIDIRSPTSFGAGHVPGSISLWREGLPSFMGWFFDYQRPIIVVDDFNLELDKVLLHFIRSGL